MPKEELTIQPRNRSLRCHIRSVVSLPAPSPYNMLDLNVALVGVILHSGLLIIYQVSREFGAGPLPCVKLTPHTYTGLVHHTYQRCDTQVSHFTSFYRDFWLTHVFRGLSEYLSRPILLAAGLMV